MPVNFPSNPSLNQTYTFTNTTWKWNGIGWEIVYNTRQTGATGATGLTGSPGSPGGATGATGPAGPAGSPGGATGATGPSGTPGTIGIDGATGATGPQGPSGSPGSPGGATGATGAQGATGSPGTPGGATGATGAPGPAGSGANVAVRDEGNLVVAAVSSLNFVGAGVAATATGSNVTITISATGNSQFYYTNVAPTNAAIGDRWLDSETLKEFVYANIGAGPQWIEPAGDGGFVGATGPTGAAGSQGATGATGIGATGATGTAGVQGATGTAGAPGSPGTAGATGATGAAGSPGSAGSPGTAGATGATGTAGSPGTAGATGATGVAGGVSYSVTNSGASSYLIAGSSNPALTLVKGFTYYFNVSATGHPFWIKTAQVTGTGSAYSSGVTNNGVDSGIVAFTVPFDAPATLYYICQFHGSMVGTLTVADSAVGATGTAGTPGAAGATGATGTAGTPGAAGATGATGTAGTPGSAGSPGTAGATGATGPAGTSANISVFDEGSLVTASVSGINFVGPGITANLVSGNVQVSVTATGTGGFNFSNAAPATPSVGDRWLNSETLAQYVYINDGDSSQWVEPITRSVSSNLTNVSTHILPNSNVTYDLGSSSLRWRDLYLSGNSIILGGATLTASGSAIALPAGSTVGGQNLATGSDVSTGGGPKITNLQVTSNVYVVLDDTAVDTVGGFIKLTGTNFVTGCMIYVGTVPANSTTFVNSTEVRAQLPATAAGTYPVYLVNPDGGTAIRVPGVTFSASPAWQTASNLGEQYDGILLNLSVVAIDATSYTLVSGSLPPGLSLNSNTGVISGTVTGVTNDTVYSFTINAVDPQLQDSPRTFTVTITVSDPYFKLTTLLLSGSAVSANTVIRDSSTNNFNLTVFGDARASNFTPYGTGWSVYFDGTGDLLTGTITGGVGSGDFTLEYWVYHNTLTDWQTHFATTRGVTGFNVGTDATGDFVFYDNVGGTGGRRIEVIGAITVNRWYHFAFSRSGTSLRGFLDGTLRGTYTTSQDYSATAFYIGALDTTQEYTNGYISNLRLVKGTALYTANFTPATTNLTSVANTSLLTCNVNRFRDSSVNNFTITRNGDARVVSFNPFNITNTGVDGSMYFDGTDDYVATPSNAAFGFSGTWTIECWFYVATTSGCRLWQTSNEVDNCEVNSPSVGYVNYYNGAASVNSGAAVVVPFSWTHLAAVCTANSTKVYVNGVLAITHSTSNTTARSIGIGGSSNLDFLGYISNFRVVNGTALYSSNFTPPAQPLTAIANTQLLTLQYDQPHNNHTFLDSSSNQFVITRSGNATQGTFSPFSQAGWSNYLGTSSERLTTSTSNSGFSFGTGDFTVEAWVYVTDTTNCMFFQMSTASTGYNSAVTNSVAAYIGSGATPSRLEIYAANSQYNSSSAVVSATTINQWHHFAIVRASGVTKAYWDGTVVPGLDNITDTFNYSTTYCVIGTVYNNTYALKGYISNFRVVKGRAVYTANFTPPTTAVGTTSGGTNPPQGTECVFLTAQSNRFRDSSSNNIGLTATGSPSIQAFSPFAPTSVYNPVVHGGSAYFDGTGDSLAISSTNAFTYGTAAFTIEAWVYSTGPGATRRIYHQMNTGSNQVTLLQTSANKINAFINLSGVAFCDILSVNNLQAYAWNHVAFVRSGNNFALFINGIREGTASSASSAPDTGATVYIGTLDSSEFWLGYISNLRAIKGVAVYDPTQTTVPVPTAPVTATTNTSLLLNFTDAAILDSTGRNVLETVADAKTSSVVTKFTGGSMSFDGTGDALYRPNSDLFNYGTGNFTIDFWIYYNSISGYQTIASLGYSPQVSTGWLIQTGNGDGKIIFYVQGSGTIIASDGGAAISTNQWYHIAVVRNSSTTTIYRNGTSVGSGADTTNYTSTGVFYIGGGTSTGLNGAYFNGYLADFRITKGQARYTGNFTAPTAPARLK